MNQDGLPEHLRDDAPYQRCNRCGRKTWTREAFGTEDRMPQPDGNPCGGRFTGGVGGDVGADTPNTIPF